MSVLIVADVHANLEAFRAVLSDAEAKTSVESVWSLGDLVGYGPEPAACIELLRSYPHEAVAGNHDLAASGVMGVEDFNEFAAAAALWTGAALDSEMKTWLGELARVRVLDPGITLSHGSLIDPVWEYLFSTGDAAVHFEIQTTAYSLVGHTHLPRVFYESQAGPAAQEVPHGALIELKETRLVANPGSAGQPRDGDPRAAYALLDLDQQRLNFYRVEYDTAATQKKMRAVGLPEYLVERLSRGR